jgi:uncharacterized protein YkvS
MFKYFTNASKGFEGESIAINKSKIATVVEFKSEDGEAVTILYALNGNSWEVKDNYLEVVARLNEV